MADRGRGAQPIFRPSVLPRLANPCRFQSDGSADASGSDTSIARAALVSCRRGEVLDEIVGDRPPVGGAQRSAAIPSSSITPTKGPDLTDGLMEDSHTHHSPFDLGNDDRRGGNEEEVAQEVRIVAPIGLGVVGAKRRTAAVRSVKRALRTSTSTKAASERRPGDDPQRNAAGRPPEDTTLRHERRGGPVRFMTVARGYCGARSAPL